MRCTSCDYPLWNLPARQCPECGQPFRPSEHEFKPHAVRFCCPHCDQGYFGTDQRGQLDPPLFDCAQCGRRIHMDEMVLRPASGWTEAQTQADRMPWLERRERGLLRSWFASIGWAMVQPNRVIRAVPAEQPVGGAWMYAVLTTIIILLLGVLLPQAFCGVMIAAPGGLPFNMWTATGLSLLTLVVLCAVFPIIWAWTAHAILKMTGRNTRALSRTCHAIYYSAGANIPSALPCLGPLIGMTWWVISAASMLKEAHHAHGGRAALAALVWPVLFSIGGVLGWYAWAMMLMIRAVGGFPGGGVAPASVQTYQLNMAVISYGWQANGAGPEHAIELALGGSNLRGWATPGGGGAQPFCEPGTGTTPADIPLGDGTMKDYLAANRRAQLSMAVAELESLPDGLIAHRLGDFVFTYHRASLNTQDPNLWVVVMLPDPAANGMSAPGDAVYIGTADYQVTSTTFDQLSALLKKQNAHRATLGLPPLPDLTTITHETPATATTTTSGTSEEPASEENE